MSGRFAGRAAVVSGAGQGIGREIARQLALAGARVLLNDRDAALAEQAARELRAEGGEALAAGGDVADPGVTRGLVEQAAAAWGRLDLAVANAGITLHRDFLEYRPEDLDRLLAVNLRGSFFLAQAAALRFREQASPGRILFLSSVTGHLAIRQMAAYGMTKAALEALARNLSAELAGLGITVNAIAPGATITPRTIAEPGWEAAWAAATPDGRVGTGSDVAAAALFLLSDEAAHVTGQSLVIDGGWTALGAAPGVFDPPERRKIRP
jgi:glucose 1-dehydrogenase